MCQGTTLISNDSSFNTNSKLWIQYLGFYLLSRYYHVTCFKLSPGTEFFLSTLLNVFVDFIRSLIWNVYIVSCVCNSTNFLERCFKIVPSYNITNYIRIPLSWSSLRLGLGIDSFFNLSVSFSLFFIIKCLSRDYDESNLTSLLGEGTLIKTVMLFYFCVYKNNFDFLLIPFVVLWSNAGRLYNSQWVTITLFTVFTYAIYRLFPLQFWWNLNFYNFFLGNLIYCFAGPRSILQHLLFTGIIF